MRRGAVLILAVAALAAAAHEARGELSSEQRRQLLAEAEAAYDEGVALLGPRPREAAESFEDAQRRFQQVLDDGVVNGRLHYNLANAYLQTGDVGRAILHYRAAEKLIPGDARLEHNIEYARSLVRSRVAPSGGRALWRALLFWHHGTSLRARAWAFAVFWLAFWALAVAGLLRGGGAWRWGAAAAAAGWIACGASVAAELAASGDLSGVVLADDVTVRKGHGEGYEPQFAEPLHQGVEFDVRDERAGWLLIELPNGKTGWIPSDRTGLIG